MPAPIYQQQFDQRAALAISRGQAAPKSPASSDDDGFSFDDFLDIINPLQHLPVVSTIYRALTHDSIKPVERIAGDTLYGGLWGFVSSVANVAFEKLTGKDFGDTAIALLTGSGDKTTAIAAASPAQQVATAAPARLSPFSYAADTSQAPASGAAQPGASAAPARLSQLASNGQASGLDATENADALALATSLRTRNVDPGLATRAMAAYRRAIDVSQPALNPIF